MLTERVPTGSILRITICGCLTAALVFPWFQGGPRSSASVRAELMHADLLSRRDWKSTEVQVAGLYLGMLRNEANTASGKNGFRLTQAEPPVFEYVPCSDSSECFLASSGNYENVSIHFGKNDEIVQIDLCVGNHSGSILRSLKGQSYRFFNDRYTDALRLLLFGPETKRELVDGGYGPVAKDTQYIFANRGITVTTSLNPMTTPHPNLETLSLIQPAAEFR
jgi:hypothetical protein